MAHSVDRYKTMTDEYFQFYSCKITKTCYYYCKIFVNVQIEKMACNVGNCQSEAGCDTVSFTYNISIIRTFNVVAGLL